jgi:hypothetical protein
VGAAPQRRNAEGRRIARTFTRQEERVQLDGWLGRPERCPRIDRQAQIDGRGVESIDRFVQIDADRIVRVQRPGNADQVLCQIGIDLPRPRSICIGQRIARHGRPKAQAMEASSLRGQTRFDVAQRLAKGQLRERHGVELIEIRKRLDLAFAVVTRHTATKRRQRQVCHHLHEHELALMHRSPLRKSSRKGAKCAPRSSNRDQEKNAFSVCASIVCIG